MNTTPLILRRAADLIEARGWARLESSPLEGPLCAGIAISVARDERPNPWNERYAPHLAFMKAMHLDSRLDDIGAIFAWNDQPGRTKEEVTAALRTIAAQLEVA